MGIEQISFLAGKDAHGGNVWIPASVEDREERDDGEWLYVLPAFSDSEDAARWVKATDVRIPTSSHGTETPEPASTATPRHLRVVK